MPLALPNRLHDTRLEPTDRAVDLPPINGVPVHGQAGSRTSRGLACRQICFAPWVSWPRLSRDGRPGGSGLPFGREVGSSLSAPLQGGVGFFPRPLPAALPATLASRFPSGEGGRRVYHVPYPYPRGVGRVSRPVARRRRARNAEPWPLATHLLVPAYQHLWLVEHHGLERHFTWVDRTTHSWLPTAW